MEEMFLASDDDMPVEKDYIHTGQAFVDSLKTGGWVLASDLLCALLTNEHAETTSHALPETRVLLNNTCVDVFVAMVLLVGVIGPAGVWASSTSIDAAQRDDEDPNRDGTVAGPVDRRFASTGDVLIQDDVDTRRIPCIHCVPAPGQTMRRPASLLITHSRWAVFRAGRAGP